MENSNRKRGKIGSGFPPAPASLPLKLPARSTLPPIPTNLTYPVPSRPNVADVGHQVIVETVEPLPGEESMAIAAPRLFRDVIGETLGINKAKDVIIRDEADFSPPDPVQNNLLINNSIGSANTENEDNSVINSDNTLEEATTIPEGTSIPESNLLPEITSIPEDTSTPEATTIVPDTLMSEDTTVPEDTMVESTTMQEATTIPEATQESATAHTPELPEYRGLLPIGPQTTTEDDQDIEEANIKLLVNQFDIQELKNILKFEAQAGRRTANSGLLLLMMPSSEIDPPPQRTATDNPVLIARLFEKDFAWYIERHSIEGMNLLRSTLIDEAKVNALLLETATRYFDLSRRNAIIISVDQLRQPFNTQSDTQSYGPDRALEIALKQLLKYINFRSAYDTKINALKALRDVGKDEVRGFEQPGREGAILEYMEIVVLRMTKQERKMFVNRYGSLAAYSNFWKNVPSDDEMNDMLNEPEEKWAKDYGKRLDDAALLVAPMTDSTSINLGWGVIFGEGGTADVPNPALHDDFSDLRLELPEDSSKPLEEEKAQEAGGKKVALSKKKQKQAARNKKWEKHSSEADDRKQGKAISVEEWDHKTRERAKKKAFKQVYGIQYHIDGYRDEA